MCDDLRVISCRRQVCLTCTRQSVQRILFLSVESKFFWLIVAGDEERGHLKGQAKMMDTKLSSALSFSLSLDKSQIYCCSGEEHWTAVIPNWWGLNLSLYRAGVWIWPGKATPGARAFQLAVTVVYTSDWMPSGWRAARGLLCSVHALSSKYGLCRLLQPWD